MAKATNGVSATKNTPKKAAASTKKGTTMNSPSIKKNAQSNTNDKGTKEKSKPMDSQLSKLFVDSLKDIYWAEKALTKALPKMAKASTSDDLRTAFQDHLTETQTQIQRLETVFEIIGQKPQAKKCEAMAGLTKEADEMISETEKGTETRDVALIMAAQKVEHYEIATYGSLATLAAQLGFTDAKELLGQTLDEEKNADLLLTELAVSHINAEAEAE